MHVSKFCLLLIHYVMVQGEILVNVENQVRFKSIRHLVTMV